MKITQVMFRALVLVLSASLVFSGPAFAMRYIAPADAEVAPPQQTVPVQDVVVQSGADDAVVVKAVVQSNTLGLQVQPLSKVEVQPNSRVQAQPNYEVAETQGQTSRPSHKPPDNIPVGGSDPKLLGEMAARMALHYKETVRSIQAAIDNYGNDMAGLPPGESPMIQGSAFTLARVNVPGVLQDDLMYILSLNHFENDTNCALAIHLWDASGTGSVRELDRVQSIIDVVRLFLARHNNDTMYADIPLQISWMKLLKNFFEAMAALSEKISEGWKTFRNAHSTTTAD